MCWWLLNPFWRHQVFLFLVYFPSSFPYSQIYYSLGFPPVLHYRIIRMVLYFLLCWVYTLNKICWMSFFFLTGSLQREPIIILSLHVINSGPGPVSPKHLSNLFVLYTWAFSCINFIVRHLTLFVIKIPQWLNHFMILCTERASEKLLPTPQAQMLRVLLCIWEILY